MGGWVGGGVDSAFPLMFGGASSTDNVMALAVGEFDYFVYLFYFILIHVIFLFFFENVLALSVSGVNCVFGLWLVITIYIFLFFLTSQHSLLLSFFSCCAYGMTCICVCVSV